MVRFLVSPPDGDRIACSRPQFAKAVTTGDCLEEAMEVGAGGTRIPPRTEDRAKDKIIVSGVLNLTSTAHTTRYVYVPDKFLFGEETANISAVTLFDLVGLKVPSLLFRVANGPTVDEWHLLRPPASGDQELDDARIAHYRMITKMKLRRILTQTARSAVEANAYFRVYAYNNDFIGSYVREACDENKNRVIAVGRMQDYVDEVHSALTGVDAESKTTKSVGKLSVMEIGGEVVLDDGRWHNDDDGVQESRTTISSKQYTQNQIHLFGVDQVRYPTPNATHLFVAETRDGQDALNKILEVAPMGEFSINGHADTMHKITDAISNERPVFLFKHSGGSTDLFTMVLDQLRERCERGNPELPFSHDESAEDASDRFPDGFTGPASDYSKQRRIMRHFNAWFEYYAPQPHGSMPPMPHVLTVDLFSDISEDKLQDQSAPRLSPPKKDPPLPLQLLTALRHTLS